MSSDNPAIAVELEASLRWGRGLLIAACLSSAAMLSLALRGGPLSLDECGSYWTSETGSPVTAMHRSLSYTALPPLSSWIEMAFLAVGGEVEWVFRLPSVLFGFFAVIVAYCIGREVRGPVCGGVAALLLALHPEALDEVRIARCYGLVLFLSATVLWTTLVWWKSKFSWRFGLLWALASSALVWTHYTSALLPFLCAVVSLAACQSVPRDQRRSAMMSVLVALLFVGATCIPLVAPLLRLMEWGPLLNYSPTRATIWDLQYVIGPIWWAGLPAGVVTAWFMRRSSETSPRVGRCKFWLLAVCALLPLLAFAAMTFGSASSMASPRYRLAYVPAGACLIAVVLTSFKGRMASVAAAAVAIMLPWFLSPALPWDLVRLANPADTEWHELNLYINEHGIEGEPVFVQSGLTEGYLVPLHIEDRAFMEYVACRVTSFYVDKNHPRYALPFIWHEATGVYGYFGDQLESIRQIPGSFWVAAAVDTDLNQISVDQISGLAIESGYELVDSKRWPSAVLLRFRYQPTIDPN